VAPPPAPPPKKRLKPSTANAKPKTVVPPPAPGAETFHHHPPKPARRGGFYFLVSAELVLIGPVEKAIGTDAFFEQIYERTGREVNVSARLGVESEVWRRRLRLRAGTYFEPSRFDNHYGRVHGTFGFELRLFDFKAWGPRSLGFSSAVDLASRYSNVSVSLGFWH
jgi:hypothetical protein